MAPLHNINQHWEIASLALKFGKYHSPLCWATLAKMNNTQHVSRLSFKGEGGWFMEQTNF